jgi:uncharacterized protein YqhQ
MAKFYYGGQAMIEGVMMRGRRSVAVAIRRPEGEIYLHKEDLEPKIYQNKYLRWPFLRGVVLLWEMLVLGTRLMTFSANIAAGALVPTTEPAEDSLNTQPQAAGMAATSTATATATATEDPAALGGVSLALAMVIPLVGAVAIFFVLPLLLTNLLHNQIGTGWLNVLVEGLIRLALLLIYLTIIGRLSDIQRVFGYHGAEHKAINTMEQGYPLDVAHVRQASRVHIRCGTGFLLLVMVVSIVVFAFVGSPSLLIKVISRIVLIPVVAAIAYEIMRLGASNYRFRVVRWLMAPGLALQGLTTREPDDSMIECAIASLECVMAKDAEEESLAGATTSNIPAPLATNV